MNPISYIHIVDYLNLCSLGALEILNYSFESGKMRFSEVSYVDLKRKGNKDIFVHVIEENLKKLNTFGKKIIVVNTCKPWDNWKQENNKQKIEDRFFYDKGLFFNKIYLEQIIDKTWNKLKEERNYYCIENKNLDTEDLIYILSKKLGSIAEVEENNLSVIYDSNLKLDSTEDIPQYLIEEVELDLKQNQIIN